MMQRRLLDVSDKRTWTLGGGPVNPARARPRARRAGTARKAVWLADLPHRCDGQPGLQAWPQWHCAKAAAVFDPE